MNAFTLAPVGRTWMENGSGMVAFLDVRPISLAEPVRSRPALITRPVDHRRGKSRHKAGSNILGLTAMCGQAGSEGVQGVVQPHL